MMDIYVVNVLRVIFPYNKERKASWRNLRKVDIFFNANKLHASIPKRLINAQTHAL